MIHPKASSTFLGTILLACAGNVSAEPGAATATPAAKAPAAAASEAAPVAAWLRSTSEVDAKLYAAIEDLKTRTDHRRMLPGGSATKKAPFLRTQLDDLEKRNAILRFEIATIAQYKTRNPQSWTEEWENQFLELQISEQTILQNLSELHERLAVKHHWWEIGK